MADLSPSLTGRRALITGANTGIGRALALGCANAGADVIVHHSGDETGASDVARAIVDMGRQADILELDFTSTQAVNSAAKSLAASDPAIDILILNAAVEQRVNWTDIGADLIQHHLSVNYTASLIFLAKLVPSMSARGWGRIVGIGSILASRPRAETAIYASLKSAQKTALQAIARDVAASGVTINLVSPGSILTDRSAQALSDPATASFVKGKIPANRIGEPKDCVAPVLMLCSDAASYITGADIPVDGGWHIGDAMGRS